MLHKQVKKVHFGVNIHIHPSFVCRCSRNRKYERERERERGFHLYDRQNVESEALQGKRDLHTREKMKISDEWII